MGPWIFKIGALIGSAFAINYLIKASAKWFDDNFPQPPYGGYSP